LKEFSHGQVNPARVLPGGRHRSGCAQPGGGAGHPAPNRVVVFGIVVWRLVGRLVRRVFGRVERRQRVERPVFAAGAPRGRLQFAHAEPYSVVERHATWDGGLAQR
jgi:hypothetical protein